MFGVQSPRKTYNAVRAISRKTPISPYRHSVRSGDYLTKKIKILTISDHPLSLSGVGTQTRYVIESLLKTGRFEVISLG